MITPVISLNQLENLTKTEDSVERAIQVLPSIFVSLENDWDPQAAQRALENQGRPQQFCFILSPRDAFEALSLLDQGLYKIIISCKTTEDIDDLLQCGSSFPAERLGAIFDIDTVDNKFLDHLPTLLPLLSFIAFTASGSDEAHSKVLKLSRSQKANYRGKWGFVQNYGSTDHLREVCEEGVLCMIPISKMSLDEEDPQKIDLAAAIVSCIKTDREDGLIPTCVSNEIGVNLGLAYSSVASIRESLKTRQGVYLSRKHGIWHKGLTSGSTQDLKRISVDCDFDTLSFSVIQHGSGKYFYSLILQSRNRF